MNENQQELLNFIYQHNLSPEDAARYVRDLDVPVEDKQAVLQDYQQRQEKQLVREEEQRKKEEEARRAETQEKLDNIVPNLRAATQQLDSSKAALDEKGTFASLFWTDYYADEPDPYTTYLNSLGEFGKVRAESMRLLEQAGRKDVGEKIKAPSYGLGSSFMDSFLSMAGKQMAGTALEVANLFGSDRAEEFASAAETYGIVNAETKHKEGFATQFSDITRENAFGSIVSFMGDQVPNLALTLIAAEAAMAASPALFASSAATGLSVGGRAALMSKRFLAIQTQAPALLNVLLRSGGTFADVYNDPNLSSAQKYGHSFFVGAIEGAGDTFLSMLAGVAPNPIKGMAPKMTSKFGKIVGANAVTRSAAKFTGASSGESFQEVSQELATMLSEQTVLGREISGAEKLNRIKEATLGGFIMGGAFRVAGAPVRAYQNIRMMADRPGDRTHIEATETFQQIKALIDKAMDENTTDTELKSINAQVKSFNRKKEKGSPADRICTES